MPTATARRAAQADKDREKRNEYQRQYRERHAEELKAKRREAKQRKRRERMEALAIAEPFPEDSIIAAAINQRHDLTTVEAEGRGKSNVVIIEHVSVDGQRCHRVKTTSYTYHRTYEAALSAAKCHKVKIQEYRQVVEADAGE